MCPARKGRQQGPREGNEDQLALALQQDQAGKLMVRQNHAYVRKLYIDRIAMRKLGRLPLVLSTLVYLYTVVVSLYGAPRGKARPIPKGVGLI